MVQQLVARGASMLALDAHGRCDEELLPARHYSPCDVNPTAVIQALRPLPNHNP